LFKIFSSSDDYHLYNRKNKDILIEKLNNSFVSYSNKNWVRIVSWKYSNDPLSIKGSCLNVPGGRFNYGDIASEHDPFGALYIAEDFDTAHKEKYGALKSRRKGLTEDELTLAKGTASVSLPINFSVSRVIDLTNPQLLVSFFKEVKKIELPKDIISKAKADNIELSYKARNLKTYLALLLDVNWRRIPMAYNIPGWPQVFGKLAILSGARAILYPSTKDGKNCLAIFPENFENSDSVLEIDRKVAPSNSNVENLVLDKNNYTQ